MPKNRRVYTIVFLNEKILRLVKKIEIDIDKQAY